MAETRSNVGYPKRPPCEGLNTLDLGLDGFAECLQVGPNTCRYALPFGYGFLCGYPRRSLVDMSTEEAVRVRRSSC